MANQNLQDAFLNNARKERLPVTIYLTSGVKLTGRVRGFDKYCVVFEANQQEQLIFKHAIATVVIPRQSRSPSAGSLQRKARDEEAAAEPGIAGKPSESPDG